MKCIPVLEKQILIKKINFKTKKESKKKETHMKKKYRNFLSEQKEKSRKAIKMKKKYCSLNMQVYLDIFEDLNIMGEKSEIKVEKRHSKEN